MKIEGIPNNIEACHHHDVNIQLHIDKETTDNIKDIIGTVFYAGVSAYAAKIAVNYTIDAAWRLGMLLGQKL